LAGISTFHCSFLHQCIQQQTKAHVHIDFRGIGRGISRGFRKPPCKNWTSEFGNRNPTHYLVWYSE